MKVKAVLLVFLAALCAEAFASEPVKASESRADVNLLLKRTEDAPGIDGRLEDPCWKKAEWSEPFLVLGAMSKTVNQLWLSADEKFVKTASRAAMLFDDRNLYLAIRSPFPGGMKPLAEKKQGEDVYRDDHAEFFLKPAGSADFYYQLLVNANGAWQGLKHSVSNGKSEKWIPEGLQIAAVLGEDHFDIELALPFASVAAETPESGSVWTGNFARGGKTCGGLSTWAPVGASFLSPELFGKFVFGSRKACYAAPVKALKNDMEKLGNEVPASVREAESRLTQAIEENGEDRESWGPLHDRIRRLENLLVQTANKGKTHLIWQDDPWKKVGPDREIPMDTKELEVLNLETARGARAIAAFMVSNLTDRMLMTNIRFVPDLKKKKIDSRTQVFSANARFRELAYIEMNGGKMIPDPIFELPVGSMLRVAPNTTSIVWLDIDTADLKPGNYAGTIRLFPSYSGFEQKEIKLNLRVSPVDISRVFVRTWTYRFRGPAIFPYLKEYGFNTVRANLSDYTPVFNAEGKAEFPRLEAILRALEANGVPREEMMWIFYPEFFLWSNTRTDDGKMVKFLEPEWKKIWTARYRLLRDWLKEQGFGYDQYAFYPTDEPNGDPADPAKKAYYAFEGGKFLKEVDPNFRIAENPYQVKDGRQKQYFELCDILIPFYPAMDRPLIEEYRKSGREIWSYTVYNKGFSPAAYRHRFWENLEAGFPGPACFYALFENSSDPFNSYDSNGQSTSDYGAAYMNPRTDQLAPSRRLEAWYLGLVDFKTAGFCRLKIEERKKSGFNTEAEERELSEIIQEGFRSGGDMDAAGKRLLDLAEKLMK